MIFTVFRDEKEQQSFNLLTDMRTIACVTLYIGCYFIHVIMFLLVFLYVQVHCYILCLIMFIPWSG